MAFYPHFKNEEVQDLSRKLATVTSADLKDEAFRRRVVESSMEIKELESKLKTAYVMKERHKQVVDKQMDKIKEKENAKREWEEDDRRLQIVMEVERRKLLYEKWKKERYCKELVEQAVETRMMRQQVEMEERQLDEKLLQEMILREIQREESERAERVIKKRRLAEDLQHCIKLQKQWQIIQKLIETEEDRIIEECKIQRHRLSEMQKQERKEKSAKLAAIRQRLGKALEMEERRRKEREELWVEYAYEEKEDIAEQKAEEERRQQQAHREKLKKTVEEQLEELEKRKIQQKEERQFEQLLALEQAALAQRAEEAEAAKRQEGRTLLRRQQESMLEEHRERRKIQREKEEEERRQDETRQALEDRAIAEERRRILEQHAPLLMGFLPPGVFRDLDELITLPGHVQAQFKRQLRPQDDPDLW